MTAICTLMGAVACLGLAALAPVAACLAIDRHPPHRAMALILALNVGGFFLACVGLGGLLELGRQAWGAIR